MDHLGLGFAAFILRRALDAFIVGAVLFGSVAEAGAQERQQAFMGPPRQGILLVRHRPDTQTQTHSWFGGLPRMPARFEWPVGGRARRPMTFLAQIDLADLPNVSDRRLLPETGVFWFFAALDDAMMGEPVVRVLYAAAHDASWEERPAPRGLLPMAEGYAPLDWLPKNDAWRQVDIKAPLVFYAMDSYSDLSTGAAVEPTFDVLKRALGRAPRPGPAEAFRGSDLYSEGWPESWPSAGLFAEFAARAAIHELPPITTLAGHSSWTSAALRLRQQLAREGRSRAGYWSTRRLVAPTDVQRAEFRIWLESFAERSANVDRDQSGGWRMPEARSISRAVGDTTAFGAYQLLASGAPELVPQEFRGEYDWPGSRPPLHQMLGYGFSWQQAPREHMFDVLLLQIADAADLFWFDDGGCAFHFWISRPALAAQRFDQVESTLECD